MTAEGARGVPRTMRAGRGDTEAAVSRAVNLPQRAGKITRGNARDSRQGAPRTTGNASCRGISVASTLGMTSIQRLQCVVLGLLAAAATASAQTPLVAPSSNMWSHGTTLNVFGGGAATPGDRGAAAGGAFGWELTSRFALEGSGTWLDFEQSVHAFTAAMTAHVAVMTPHPFVPFLAGGVGLYHASFNRFDSTMPRFYHRRMTGLESALGQTVTFTDPSLAGGGGINVYVSRHWALRPEVLATLVLRDSRSFVVTMGAVRLAYHFDDHPVTPR